MTSEAVSPARHALDAQIILRLGRRDVRACAASGGVLYHALAIDLLLDARVVGYVPQSARTDPTLTGDH